MGYVKGTKLHLRNITIIFPSIVLFLTKNALPITWFKWNIIDAPNRYQIIACMINIPAYWSRNCVQILVSVRTATVRACIQSLSYCMVFSGYLLTDVVLLIHSHFDGYFLVVAWAFSITTFSIWRWRNWSWAISGWFMASGSNCGCPSRALSRTGPLPSSTLYSHNSWASQEWPRKLGQTNEFSFYSQLGYLLN